VRGTLAAVQRDLTVRGLIARYRTASQVDALPPGEGVFLACSFWLVDNLALAGRRHEAEALFKRLLAVCNDVGLVAEMYDPIAKRQLGNFPQALTHVALINSARNLSRRAGKRGHHLGATAELATALATRSGVASRPSLRPDARPVASKTRRAPAGARKVDV
jgi:hypothetical protein